MEICRITRLVTRRLRNISRMFLRWIKIKIKKVKPGCALSLASFWYTLAQSFSTMWINESFWIVLKIFYAFSHSSMALAITSKLVVGSKRATT